MKQAHVSVIIERKECHNAAEKAEDVKAVLFDMDGVIFDSERLYLDCCAEAAAELNMENIEEVCLRCIGVTKEITRAILLEAYREETLVDRFTAQAVSLFREKYREGRLEMKPGVVELLQELKKNGVKTAIASSTKTEIVEKEILDAGIRPYFDCVVGGDQAGRSKPNPDIFLKTAEELEEAPESCVVIEDSFNGIRAAKAAGMTAIMVPDLLAPDKEIRTLADHVVSNLYEAGKILSGLVSEKLRKPDSRTGGEI